MTPTSNSAKRRHDTLSGMTGRGTDRRTIRADDDLWSKFDQACRALGVDRSTWLRDAMRWCIGDPTVSRPKRPPVDE